MAQPRSLVALACAFIGLVGCGTPKRPPAPVVVSATEVGVLPRNATIRGRDGGPSAVAFGRSVWTYGDTVLEAPDAIGESWHTNSFGIATGPTWSDGFTEPVDAVGAPRYFIDRSAEEVAWDDAHAAETCASPPCGVRWAIWPSAPLYDSTTDTAWVLYGLYADTQPSGIGVAIWRGLDQSVERQRVGDSWLLFPSGEPEYANAPTVHDGYLYAFACTGDFYSRPCTLGRVPLAEVATRASWRFYDGASWVADYHQARSLFEGAPIMSVVYAEALASWVLVYTPPFDAHVYARTAPQLEGPWSDAVALFQVDGDAPYDANVHAELAEDGGTTQYVTYSRPQGDALFATEHAVWRVVLAAP